MQIGDRVICHDGDVERRGVIIKESRKGWRVHLDVPKLRDPLQAMNFDLDNVESESHPDQLRMV